MPHKQSPCFNTVCLHVRKMFLTYWKCRDISSSECTRDHSEGNRGRKQSRKDNLSSTKTNQTKPKPTKKCQNQKKKPTDNKTKQLLDKVVGGGKKSYRMCRPTNPFPSESQQMLFKRKLIHFPELVKIFVERQTQLRHSSALFIKILAIFAWTCLGIMICMTNAAM